MPENCPFDYTKAGYIFSLITYAEVSLNPISNSMSDKEKLKDKSKDAK